MLLSPRFGLLDVPVSLHAWHATRSGCRPGNLFQGRRYGPRHGKVCQDTAFDDRYPPAQTGVCDAFSPEVSCREIKPERRSDLDQRGKEESQPAFDLDRRQAKKISQHRRLIVRFAASAPLLVATCLSFKTRDFAFNESQLARPRRFGL